MSYATMQTLCKTQLHSSENAACRAYSPSYATRPLHSGFSVLYSPLEMQLCSYAAMHPKGDFPLHRKPPFSGELFSVLLKPGRKGSESTKGFTYE